MRPTSRIHKNLGLIGCEAAPDEHEYTRSDQVKLLRTTSMRVQTLDCDQGEHNLSLTRSGSSVRRGFEDAAAAKPPTPGLPTPIPLKRSRSYLKFTPHKQLSKHEKEDRVTNVLHARLLHGMHTAFDVWAALTAPHRGGKAGGAMGTPAAAGPPKVLEAPKARCGLRNLGNTCYLNCLLQAQLDTPSLYSNNSLTISCLLPCLIQAELYTPMLRVMICRPQAASYKTPDRGSLSTCLWSSLCSLFHSLWSQPRVIYTPSGFLDTVWQLFPDFAGFRQQDPHEILSLMLDDLTERSSPKQQAEAVALLGGDVSTLITHRKGPSTRSIQAFIGPITLEIPPQYHQAAATARRAVKQRGAELPSCQLDECFDAACSVEELSGGDATSIQRGWARLPPVLVLHLNRTSWVTGQCKKVTADVGFPLEGLRVGKWSEGAETPYDLYAIVQHHGRSMQEGHYSTLVRCGGVGSEATWWHMNDAKVKRATEEEVRAAPAYLLFYQRRE